MKHMHILLLLLVLILSGTSAGWALNEGELCTLKGIGTVPPGDFYYGDVVQFTDHSIVGTWIHRLPTGERIVGEPDFMFCRPNGSRLIDLAGPATFNGENGYSFILAVHDRGWNQGFGITHTLTASRTPSPSTSEDGVLPFERPLVRIPESIQIVDGTISDGWAHLSFDRLSSHDRVTCRYRTNGTIFELKKCTGEKLDSPPVEANCIVQAVDLRLHLQEIKPNVPATIQVDLQVTPNYAVDTYQLLLFDPTGGQIYTVYDDQDTGDLNGEF
ncbi:MAG: hypothetical protein MRJ96_14440 [Nitrospirales bacterium]|nr:hypothetical protein [Nitrospira sp.]MDR4502639.1 hypothetical protein [Nitrospirales bacterium]